MKYKIINVQIDLNTARALSNLLNRCKNDPPDSDWESVAIWSDENLWAALNCAGEAEKGKAMFEAFPELCAIKEQSNDS